MPRVVFDEESQTGLGFEIGQLQQKFQRKPTLQSLSNPAVGYTYKDCTIVGFVIYFPKISYTLTWIRGYSNHQISEEHILCNYSGLVRKF